MIIDVYKTKKKNAYVMTEQGKKIGTLPKQIQELIGDNKLWKTINTNQKHLTALDPVETIESNIAKQGYHIQGVEVVVKESIGKP